MKEIKIIVKAYQQIDFSKTKAALAAVESIETLSYRMTDAYMPVMNDVNCTGGTEEIALSIVAEIQLHFKKRQGQSLRQKEGTIHEP